MSATDLRQEWIDRFGFDMEETPKCLDELLGDGIMPSANEFIEAGVTPAEYLEWYYEVNGFDIDRMKELIAAGFSVSQLKTSTDLGYGGYSSTVAYKYCNGDLDLEEVKGIVNA